MIQEHFHEVYKGNIFTNYLFVSKEELIPFFKQILNQLPQQKICFDYDNELNREEEKQFIGDMQSIEIIDNKIVLKGDFKKTTFDEEKQESINELVVPLHEINKDIKLIFEHQSALGIYMRQEFPQRTVLKFYVEMDLEQYSEYYYKKYELVFYVNHKGLFAPFLEGRNIAYTTEFTKEEQDQLFFEKIKEDLIGKTLHYWTVTEKGYGEHVEVPILSIEFTKEIRHEEEVSLFKITTQYNTEEIRIEDVSGIKISDNFLWFDQRKWDGSYYKVSLR